VVVRATEAKCFLPCERSWGRSTKFGGALALREHYVRGVHIRWVDGGDNDDDRRFARRVNLTTFPIALTLMGLFMWMGITGSRFVLAPFGGFVALGLTSSIIVARHRRRRERERLQLRVPYEPLLVRDPTTGRVGPVEAFAGSRPARVATAVRGVIARRQIGARSEASIEDVQSILARAAQIEDVECSWHPARDGVTCELAASIPGANRNGRLYVRGVLRAGPPTTFQGTTTWDLDFLPVVVVPLVFLIAGPIAFVVGAGSLLIGRPMDGVVVAVLWGAGATAASLQWLNRLVLVYERLGRVLQRTFGDGLGTGEVRPVLRG
jgi:hypothetical protein